MNNNIKAGTAGQAAALPRHPEQLITDSMAPGSVLLSGPVLHHLAVTQDLAAGAAAVLDLLAAEDLAADDAALEGVMHTPMSPMARAELERLAIAAARTIAEKSEQLQRWAEKYGAEVPR